MPRLLCSTCFIQYMFFLIDRHPWTDAGYVVKQKLLAFLNNSEKVMNSKYE